MIVVMEKMNATVSEHVEALLHSVVAMDLVFVNSGFVMVPVIVEMEETKPTVQIQAQSQHQLPDQGGHVQVPSLLVTMETVYQETGFVMEITTAEMEVTSEIVPSLPLHGVEQHVQQQQH